MRTAFSFMKHTRITVTRGTIIAGCLALSFATQARSETGDITASKDALVRDLCANQGRIARCVGLAADSCPSVVRPYVDKCAPRAAKDTREDSHVAFERCFWSAFLDKYGDDIRDTPECFSSDDKETLKPLPPELEREYEPLSKFEEREKTKEDASGDKKGSAADIFDGSGSNDL